MENAQGQLISTLNHLIEVGKDSELSCMTGASEVHDAQLRSILTGAAESCRSSVTELQSLVNSLGGTARDRGTWTGTLQRGWMGVMHILSPHNDDAVLQLCEREEEAARSEFRSVLTKDMPPEIRAVVQRQYDGMQLHHERIHSMRGMQVH